MASFYADPVDLHVLQATRHPAFLGDAVKLRSYWGHDAMPEIQGGAPLPPLPLSAAQGTVRTQGGGSPHCLDEQRQSQPLPWACSAINSHGHYLVLNLLGAEPRPGSGIILSSCSPTPQTGLGNH